MSFEYLSFLPESGQVRKIAFILHGYGVNASYVRKIAYAYQEHMDDVLVVAPQAPELCSGEDHGDGGFLPIPQQMIDDRSVPASDLDPEQRQWFGIETPDIDVMATRMDKVVRRLNDFADDICAAHGLTSADAAMTGFSQGGAVALCAAYMRGDNPFKCAISHSSIFFAYEAFNGDGGFTSTCPTFFIYGNNDEEFSVKVFENAAQAIGAHASHFEVQEIDGLKHKTDKRSRKEMAHYLARHL